MPVITFKALYGTGPGYLQDPLSLRTSTATRLDIMDVLASPKYCHLVEVRMHAFSVADPALGKTLPLKF